MVRFHGLVVCAIALSWAQPTAAFCGFYVAGADSKLYANATQVVLMRGGTRTVLSMQNNYQGPAEAFALVIPVPSVLKKEQVKTLPKSVFEHVDALGAPRLVEYWETDPCAPVEIPAPMAAMAMASEGAVMGSGGARHGVKIEAQFEVAEYDVLILSAKDSAGLELWLHENHYNIPEGAREALKPYVAAGTKFFVAKVDPKRVTFHDGQAALSPLRFYYDAPEFSLPVRLGLLNSQGKQDLIVNILAADRYELANYPNVPMTTNQVVNDDVRNDFPGFYEALFSRVLEQNPRAVVTEYAWDSSSCDPCPTPPLAAADLQTLGADVVQDAGGRYGSFTLTRLHYRYTRASLGQDLIFKRTTALVGGRGIPNAQGELKEATTTGEGYNNFQGRYAILHAWEGAVACDHPMRGRWGGPNNSRQPVTQVAKNTLLTGTAPRPVDLTALTQPKPAAKLPSPSPSPSPQPEAPKARETSGCSALHGPATSRPWALGMPLLAAMLRASRRSRREKN